MLEQQTHLTASSTLQITPLERDVLRRLADGTTAAEMNRYLGLSSVETESFLARLFAAMGAVTQADAITRARQRGLLMPDQGDQLTAGR